MWQLNSYMYLRCQIDFDQNPLKSCEYFNGEITRFHAVLTGSMVFIPGFHWVKSQEKSIRNPMKILLESS